MSAAKLAIAAPQLPSSLFTTTDQLSAGWFFSYHPSWRAQSACPQFHFFRLFQRQTRARAQSDRVIAAPDRYRLDNIATPRKQRTTEPLSAMLSESAGFELSSPLDVMKSPRCREFDGRRRSEFTALVKGLQCSSGTETMLTLCEWIIQLLTHRGHR